MSGTDPEIPEPALVGAERREERRRLRAVRRERRQESMSRKMSGKKDQKGKGDKKR